MLFNSLQYAFFLVIVLALYQVLSRRRQNLMLLVASYAFYAAWDWRFLSLIWISTIVDFVVGRRLLALRGRAGGRWWLTLSLATNLGLLGFFKYYGFFVDSAVALLDSAGLSLSTSTLSIVLPVGISFYTFQTLSYTIDIWRGKLDPVDSPLDFALFVAFFPQLVAGPIERAARFLPQVQRERRVGPDDVAEGVFLILVGLIRKVVIADTAGLIADRYFAAPGEHGAVALLAGVALYTLQIYGDFAGYSNIARGSARLLGFDLMRNFRHPYFAASVTEFWRRWHISLSTWLRDYLYIPLGGNRGKVRRTYVNLMLTMLLGGLWHGASWNFVIWGALHGIYLAIHRALSTRREAAGRAPWPRAAGIAVTLPVVAMTWLTFRITEFSVFGEYLAGLTRWSSPDFAALVPVMLLALILLVIDLPQHETDDEFALLRQPVVGVGVRAGAAALLLVFSAGGADVPFIYFQF
ncbi:MAG: MBOAT family O-acyltransferase [Acidimicrobiia bacterium]|nr:MBOAT family O-acyltransferase [Acidimicrobiia bacterium]